jgi:hypothetical protein
MLLALPIATQSPNIPYFFTLITDGLPQGIVGIE